MTAAGESRVDGSSLRIALVVSRFNERVTEGLLRGAEACLDEHGCGADRRRVFRVPGAWEIPALARRTAESGRFDAVVTLGALIRGETAHFDVLASSVAHSLACLAREADVPIVFGVLTTDNGAQAIARSEPGPRNKGREAARSALEMIALFRRMASPE
jgi:6,7-dimethyl-8-ribityllumazine synthase